MSGFDIGAMLVWYLVFVFSTTFHEYAHALAAYKGGDLTAYEGGQLSLDPLPHIRREPFGMVLVPLLSFFQMGWMIGWASVPYDAEWGRRNPRKHAVMSLAGPAANLSLALLALIALRVLLATGVFEIPEPGQLSFAQMVALPEGADSRSPLGAVAMALSILLNLNVLLGIFNLLPIPPLDGASVLEGAAPRQLGPIYQKLREIPMMSLLGLIIAWGIFRYIAFPVLSTVLMLLYRPL
ncbi:MAG TPA: site-2 protease family protein [Polyangiaceae bacterium]|nr:site-2 protease family protein [Polyangiaceae bacterium]